MVEIGVFNHLWVRLHWLSLDILTVTLSYCCITETICLQLGLISYLGCPNGSHSFIALPLSSFPTVIVIASPAEARHVYFLMDACKYFLFFRKHTVVRPLVYLLKMLECFLTEVSETHRISHHLFVAARFVLPVG